MKIVEYPLFITNFWYKFSNLYGIEKSGICGQKISNIVQFNNKKHLLQCKVKYNGKTIEI